MAETFLLEPFRQIAMVIGQKAIGSQDAFELLAKNIDHDFMSTTGFDRIDRDLLIGEDP